MWSSLFYLRMSHWNASSGKWRSAVPWKQPDTRTQWADWRRKSRRWKRRWQGTCRSTRISSMSNWLWILRLPHTGSSWRERRAGDLELVWSDLNINHSVWYWFFFVFFLGLFSSRITIPVQSFSNLQFRGQFKFWTLVFSSLDWLNYFCCRIPAVKLDSIYWLKRD